MFANLVRNIAKPGFQAAANPGDVEQPAQGRVGDESGAGQHDAGGEIGDMQVSVERRDGQRHDQSGDHDQRQPAERQRDLERKAAEDQRAGKSDHVGAEPRPGRADGAVMADQDIGQDHIGGDDRGGIDQVERVAPGQQEAGVQILLGQDLEHHGHRDDRHGLRRQSRGNPAPRMILATWAEMTAKPRQAGSVMLSSSSTHSERCDRTAASPLLA